MCRLAKFTLPGAILCAGILFNTTTSWAVPEFARKTKKECLFCHPSDSWQLNEAGKYYRQHKYSLDGYKPKPSEKQSQGGRTEGR